MTRTTEHALTPVQVAALRAMMDAREPLDTSGAAAAVSLLVGHEVTPEVVEGALRGLVDAGLARPEGQDPEASPSRHHATFEGMDALRAFGAVTSSPARGWTHDQVASAIFQAGRLGSVLDEDGMLGVLDAAGRPDERADKHEALRLRKVTDAVEAFVRDAHPRQSALFDGLADRPKPGRKAAAIDAARDLLHQIDALRRVVRRTKPLRIVAS